MGTAPSVAAAIQGAPVVRLGDEEKNDVLVFFGDNADVANLLLGDIVSEPDHVAPVPVDELPIHERLHVADIEDAGEKIGDEQPAARAKHLEHGPGEALGCGQGQVIKQAGRVNEIKGSQIQPVRQQLANSGGDRL